MVTIRVATLDDAARLYTWQQPSGSFAAFCKQLALQDDEHRIYVARDQARSTWVGMATLQRHGNEMDVTVLVDPGQRGKGYAAAVLDLVLDEARALNVTRVTATPADDDHAAIRALWSAGFRHASGQANLLMMNLTTGVEHR